MSGPRVPDLVASPLTVREQPQDKALPRRYRRACGLAVKGDAEHARRMLEAVERGTEDARLKALARNDLAALQAQAGDVESAIAGFNAALALDADCRPARLNLALLHADAIMATENADAAPPAAPRTGAVKVAVLSFLFNWPSTGGGTVHTLELARFLSAAGYAILHVYARYEPWGIGRVEGALPYPAEALTFDESTWNPGAIQAAFRRAVRAFGPDHVIVTDSWNSKPLLAEAVRGYPYILRFQAMEGLCPLNNVRLLPDGEGGVRQCTRHQLANPRDCADCLRRNGAHSGALHQAERALCGVGTPEYHETLVRAFAEAEAVLVVNPLMEAMVSPYTEKVRTVTAGMDPARFPWPWPDDPAAQKEPGSPQTLLFAGLVHEQIKGFDVLHEACRRLWDRRQDFELVATADPAGRVDPFTRYIGWQSQDDLPRHVRAAEILVMPTVAQEALGRTAVEAMAAGRPVIASRLGGLPFTVAEGSSGLLFEPGDADDLARKIETLLDDPVLRERMGQAGRKRFEEHYAWPVIIDRHYRPLLGRARHALCPAPTASSVAYRPHFPERVDQAKLVADVARTFGLERADVERKLATYREFHESKDYARTLGELKTLCFEEAFVWYVAMAKFRPRVVAEFGTQQGKSTRRILDIASLLDLPARVFCFDRANDVQHFGKEEAELVCGELNGRFGAIAREVQAELIFVDWHDYAFLVDAVRCTLEAPGAIRMLAIHDCGRGLCNPQMALSRDDPGITSATGVWERHVLANAFGIADPLEPRLDSIETASHRFTIFDTAHGLGVLLPLH